MKALLIFLFFLLLLLFLIGFPKTSEFIQTGRDSIRESDSGWKLIGRVEILNGRIVSMNLSSAELVRR